MVASPPSFPRPPVEKTLEAALAAAEARLEGRTERMLEAVRAVGHSRNNEKLLTEQVNWLQGLLNDQRDSRQQDLVARADEIAWLRGCLAESQAQVGVEQRARDRALDRARNAEIALAQASIGARLAQLPRALVRRLRRPGTPPLPHGPAEAVLALSHETAPAHVPVADPASDIHVEPAPAPLTTERPISAPVTTVHQFHAGSAQGDAITQSMLLIRSLLRAEGFASEIYAETCDPALANDILPLARLPTHAGYVLLLHHSMGFPSFDRLLALPARKVLIYHNITPPSLLAGRPRIEQLALLGREQLAILREHVAFALADSAFNAIELHRAGFAAVRTCPLLFDVAAMTPRPPLRPQDGVFTVLFVGRITPSKAQDDLIAAFDVFQSRFARPCRLVLVGALDPDDHLYLDALQARIDAGLSGLVQLTGLVSDEELVGWYCQADLYVSLSHHEGFGVPLVEAMAHGVPVLAWPAGAVPYTMGGAGTLLHTREPGAVADAMLAIARHGAASHPAQALQRFSLANQRPALLQALAAAGAVPPPSPEAHEALATHMRLTITGHVRGSYSLAAVNRAVARAVETVRPGTVRLVPYEDGADTAFTGLSDADQFLTTRPPAETGPQLVLSGHYPLYVPPERGDLLAALFFWEESLVPAAIVARLNAHFAAVFAPSRFVTKLLVDSGVSIPVLNIGLAPPLPPLRPTRPRGEPCTFLHVSSAFPRKGLDVLLAAWVQAFTGADPVRLVVKTFPNPHNDAAAQIGALRRAHPGAAPITLVDEDVAADGMLALFAQADAVVLPSRGEGYNLSAAEAMAAGIPVITTGYGGHLDFCDSSHARLLHYRLAPSASHLATPHSLWAEPDVADLAHAMQEVQRGAIPDTTSARAAIRAAADPATFTTRLARATAALLLHPPAPPVRLAWVSTWDVRCGIAAYSRALVEALPRDGLADVTILADQRTPASDHVEPAWQVGDAAPDGLGDAIARADADVVVIQHQPGLLPWRGLAHLVAAVADQGRAAVVTLHNTRHLRDVSAAERSLAVEALRRAARILVHTVADLEIMDEVGLIQHATLLPHAAAPARQVAVRPLPVEAAPVLGCTGYFLPDKGIGALIAAASQLRRHWPGLRLRLVNAEYDHPDSAAEIAACRALADELGMPVDWHLAYLGLGEQQALLGGCDVLVLPYQRSKESSSAALRSALATGIPVAVTKLPLFDEAAGAVFRLPGTEPAAIAEGLAALLADPAQRAALNVSAAAWLADRATPVIAQRLHGMLRGLAAQRRLGAPFDGGLWRAGG